jgi:hypothetical protein
MFNPISTIRRPEKSVNTGITRDGRKNRLAIIVANPRRNTLAVWVKVTIPASVIASRGVPPVATR